MCNVQSWNKCIVFNKEIKTDPIYPRCSGLNLIDPIECEAGFRFKEAGCYKVGPRFMQQIWIIVDETDTMRGKKSMALLKTPIWIIQKKLMKFYLLNKTVK